MLPDILNGFHTILSFGNLTAIFIGLIFGVVFGAIPGLTSTMGIALIIPLTYSMDPIMAFSAFLGAYKGGVYGGSIPAILINTPGTPVAAVTVFDGHPMAQKGEAMRAMDISLWSSVIADFISTFFLIFFAVALAKLALKFGPPEYAALSVFALLIVAGVSGDSVLKGIIASTLGFLFATVGLDPIVSGQRYTFGLPSLFNGIGLMVMLIGLFAVSEVLVQSEKHQESSGSGQEFKQEKQYSALKDVIFCLPNILRGTVIGILIGAIPGVGPTASSFLNYSEAKRTSKHPEAFGNGAVEGVAAAESGNNATVGGALIPLLALGIPGDVTTAVLLGALLIHGLTPGPVLFTENAHFVYSIFAALLLSSLLLPVVGKVAIRAFYLITRVKSSILYAVVAVLCTVGVFGFNSSFADLNIMLIFGFVGYILRKRAFPLAPLLIGFILEPLLESSIRQSLIISGGDFMIFLQRPISVAFLLLALVSVILVIKIKTRATPA